MKILGKTEEAIDIIDQYHEFKIYIDEIGSFLSFFKVLRL